MHGLEEVEEGGREGGRDEEGEKVDDDFFLLLPNVPRGRSKPVVSELS